MTKTFTLTTKTLLSILTLGTILTFTSCARKIAFQTNQSNPAARGNITVKKDNNHNYVINVQITDLAEVKRLQPAKQAYIVWMVTEGDVTKNVGQINSSTSTLSKRLKASFHTVSPIKPIKIFITAENDITTQYPGDQLILSTDKF